MAFRTAGTPEGPVGSGVDVFLMQDNTVLGYSTDMQVSEDFELEGIRSLGYYGDRDIVSMGYNINFTLSTYLLRGLDIEGSLSIPGWQPDGTVNINSAGLYTFTGLDVHTLAVLFTIVGAKYGGGDLSVAQGQLMTRQTRWRSKYMLPGLNIS